MIFMKWWYTSWCYAQRESVRGCGEWELERKYLWDHSIHSQSSSSSLWLWRRLLSSSSSSLLLSSVDSASSHQSHSDCFRRLCSASMRLRATASIPFLTKTSAASSFSASFRSAATVCLSSLRFLSSTTTFVVSDDSSHAPGSWLRLFFRLSAVWNTDWSTVLPVSSNQRHCCVSAGSESGLSFWYAPGRLYSPFPVELLVPRSSILAAIVFYLDGRMTLVPSDYRRFRSAILTLYPVYVAEGNVRKGGKGAERGQ